MCLYAILSRYSTYFVDCTDHRFSPSVAISRIKERARRASCFDRKEIQPGQKKVRSRPSMYDKIDHFPYKIQFPGLRGGDGIERVFRPGTGFS